MSTTTEPTPAPAPAPADAALAEQKLHEQIAAQAKHIAQLEAQLRFSRNQLTKIIGGMTIALGE